MTGPVLCEDCAIELRAAYAILAEMLQVKEQKIDELHAKIIWQAAEIAVLKADIQAYKDDPFRAAREMGVHDTEGYYTWSRT